jgi:hypothetical protein
MQPLVNGLPGPSECWDELAEHSLTHDDLVKEVEKQCSTNSNAE